MSDKHIGNANLSTYIIIIASLCTVVVLSAVAGYVLSSRRKKNKQLQEKNEGQAGKLRFYSTTLKTSLSLIHIYIFKVLLLFNPFIVFQTPTV